MEDDVKRVVESCEVCRLYQKQSTVQHPARAIKTGYVHCMIGIYLVLGFPESQKGHVGLVITEYLTKYPYVKAIKNKSAKEIASLLWEYVTLFGPPKVILYDNGTEFVNSVVGEMLRMIGTEHRVTSAYHPRTNGQTERMNAMQDRASWDKWIPYVLLSYRTRVHSVTKCTPFELMFGRQMTTFDVWSSTDVITEEDMAAAIYSRSCEIRKMIEVTQSQSIEYVDDAKEKQVIKQNKAQKTSNESLKEGSQVYITTVGFHDKLWERYKGPFTIVRQARSGNYIVKNVLGDEIADSFPRERLKPVSVVIKEKFLRFEKSLITGLVTKALPNTW